METYNEGKDAIIESGQKLAVVFGFIILPHNRICLLIILRMPFILPYLHHDPVVRSQGHQL